MRLRTLLTAFTATSLAATLALGAGPASAGPMPFCAGNASNAPDGKIKVLGGSFDGGGEYPFTELDVTPVAEGSAATFVLKWKNVSATTRTIRVVLGLRSLSPGTSRRIFLNGVNVTQSFGDNGIAFSGIAAGKRTPALQLVLKNKAGGEDFNTTELRARYGGASGGCDGVAGSINTK